MDFVLAKTEAGLNEAITSGKVSEDSVSFVSEAGKEAIHTKGKSFQTIPSNGKDGQVLMSQDGKGVWSDIGFLDLVSYGVSWKPDVPDPVLTRVGNINFHKTLPIQSAMKGCVYNPKEKRVVYWLDPSDWRFRKISPTFTVTGFAVDTTMSRGSGFVNGEYEQGQFVPSNQGEWSSLIYTLIDDFGMGDCKVNTYYIKVNNVVCIIQYLKKDPNSGSADLIQIIPLDSDITIPANSTATIEVGSNLTGYDGEVMVYVPEFWIRSWDEEDRREVRVSTIKVDDSWEHQPALFLGAYRDTILNTVPENRGYLSTLPVNTAICVSNSATYCRGGDNTSTNDTNSDIFLRNLKKCRTNISRPDFRTYARQAGKEIMSYRQYKNIIYWLYVIEYANFNSQAAYNSGLTTEGFHQGGLGPGLTNVTNWASYAPLGPVTPNGYTNELGNGTGVKRIAPFGPNPVGDVYAIRWRGLENPFGDIYYYVDGILINTPSTENDRVKVKEFYSTDDPSLYGDSNYQVMDKVGETPFEGSHFIKEWNLGQTAEIIPKSSGGSSNTYKCDYCDVGTALGLTLFLVGGYADAGMRAGLGSSYIGGEVNDANVIRGVWTSCIAE